MQHPVKRVLCLLAVAFVTTGPTAHADEIEHRVGGHFHIGLGGELDTNLGPFFPDADLDATIGIAGRYEARVHRYVAVGGLFGFDFWKADGADDRHNFIDLDVYVKGMYPLETGAGVLEIYAMLPFGLTVSVLDDDTLDAIDRSATGWNLAFWVGSTLFVTDAIGLFAELGFWHHSASHDIDRSQDLEGTITQAALNFGALVRL